MDKIVKQQTQDGIGDWNIEGLKALWVDDWKRVKSISEFQHIGDSANSHMFDKKLKISKIVDKKNHL